LYKEQYGYALDVSVSGETQKSNENKKKERINSYLDIYMYNTNIPLTEKYMNDTD